MAEVLAALGLAANIIQFVDFGTRLLSSSSQLYKSANGALRSNVEIEEITSDIKRVAHGIENGTSGIVEPSLKELARTCMKLAEELLAVLHGLKLDGQKNRQAEALRKSLKSFRARHKVKDIYDRLCKVREQICFHLNCLLNNRQAILMPAIHESLDSNKALATETRNKVDAIVCEIRQIIENKAWIQGHEGALGKIFTRLTNLIEQTRTGRNVHEFLKSLHFKQIKEREYQVKRAHTNTFEWIFENGDLNFVQWLHSSDDVFWIGGKAGSGKSTLMKFLLNHPRLSLLLREWADQQGLLIASHFFWSAGTPMQKSQEGLLRTLLFEIFCHSPELIPLICPNRWSNDTTTNSFHDLQPWSLWELFQTVEALASMENQRLPVKICLFIDGLDEYEGEHSDIIHVIKTLSKSPDIKLCVSSRPWTVFIDAFEGRYWKLHLQDLTRNDIRSYIKDNLEEDPRFRQLKERDSIGSEDLLWHIISKAQGVFLWVYLVVRSLLRGLMNRDDISDLQRRLGQLPGHLEAYFKHMLDTIEPLYQEQTARVFCIMANASTTLPLIALYFVDQEKNDPYYALGRQTQFYQRISAETESILDTTRRQLNARCKDLVEVTTDSDEHSIFMHKAGFLHRTVMDFLRTKDMETLMSTRSGPNFNPNLALCKSYLAQVKVLPFPEHTVFRNNVLGTLYYARELEIHEGKAEAVILDELDSTVSEKASWSTIFPKGRDGSPTHPTSANLQEGFLALAVQCSLHQYIEYKIKARLVELTRNGSRPLLCQALQRGLSISKDYTFDSAWVPEIDIQMLRLLLHLGASPTQSFLTTNFFAATSSKNRRFGSKGKDSNTEERFVWSDFLTHYANNLPDASQNDWDRTRLELCNLPVREHEPYLSNAFEACELMALHCSSKDKQFLTNFKAFKGMLRQCFSSDEVRRIEELLEEKPQQTLSWWKIWGARW